MYKKQNFKALIEGILRRGLTEKEIAERCETTQPTINRIKTGAIKTPSFDLGAKLIELNKRVRWY